MYAIYAYIGVVWGVNAGIYGIHGVSGYYMHQMKGNLQQCTPSNCRWPIRPFEPGPLRTARSPSAVFGWGSITESANMSSTSVPKCLEKHVSIPRH